MKIVPSDYFTGHAFLQPLLAKDKNNEFALGSVTFETGVIWLKPVTDGEYQEANKE